MRPSQSRRQFLSTLSLAGAAGLIGAPKSFAAEPPPETTSLRLSVAPTPCHAPEFLAEELLRAEGFSDVRHVKFDTGDPVQALARGEIDFGLSYAVTYIVPIDGGAPITTLAGVHVGCFTLIGSDAVHSIADLKGRTVATQGVGGPAQQFVSSMAVYVGLDPHKDINWVEGTGLKPMDMLGAGKIDAFMGFPGTPDPRTVKIGHVVVDSAVDRPWSQYFCCMLAGNANFVRNNPAATKRVVRAILKSADLCSTDPHLAARRIVDGGFAIRYDYDDAVQSIGTLAYDKWRIFDPEDTMRFWSLRLHEAGMIKPGPKKIIADGTDWRFLNEVKRELKG